MRRLPFDHALRLVTNEGTNAVDALTQTEAARCFDAKVCAMTTLSEDFDAYVAHLSRRNSVAMGVLVGGMIAAAILATIYAASIFYHLPGVGSVADFLPKDIRDTPFFSRIFQADNLDALHLSAVCANVSVAAALRIWYTRHEKMTALLTHALVLESEHETAIRVLLHKEMER
jgi:hypothetical protein